MSFESATAWLRQHAPDARLIDQSRSTATVAEAAEVLEVEPGRIAKTLAFRVGEAAMLLVARGDARLDNRKCKDELGGRPRMLDPEETLKLTGHAVGGVCPFGLATALPILADRSLLAFDTVFPAAGSQTSSVEFAPQHLIDVIGARWVDICRLPE